MIYGSGCSGIGGIDRGLDLAGWRCAFQIENAPFPRRVLRKHWPRVMLFSNVYHCGIQNLPRVDLFAFGFPCLDLSASAYGSHAGLDGGTSGPVFYQCARIACELRPEWLLIENVPSVKKHMAKIAAALPHWNLEYADLTASDFGAYTRRVRTFIVGHPRDRRTRPVLDQAAFPRTAFQSGGAKDVLPMCLPWKGGLSLERLGSCVIVNQEADAAGIRAGDGVSGRLDSARYLAVGNAVAPPVAEWIGRRIKEQL